MMQGLKMIFNLEVFKMLYIWKNLTFSIGYIDVITMFLYNLIEKR
jgi:hypothetical protein